MTDKQLTQPQPIDVVKAGQKGILMTKAPLSEPLNEITKEITNEERSKARPQHPVASPAPPPLNLRTPRYTLLIDRHLSDIDSDDL